jgi:hypothetical protein
MTSALIKAAIRAGMYAKVDTGSGSSGVPRRCDERNTIKIRTTPTTVSTTSQTRMVASVHLNALLFRSRANLVMRLGMTINKKISSSMFSYFTNSSAQVDPAAYRNKVQGQVSNSIG